MVRSSFVVSRESSESARRPRVGGGDVWKYLSKLRTLFGALRQQRSYSRATSGNLLKDLVSPVLFGRKSWKEMIRMDTWDLYRERKTVLRIRNGLNAGGDVRRRRKIGNGSAVRYLYFFSTVQLCRVFHCRCEKGIAWRTHISAYFSATFICRAHFRLFLCPISPILPHLRVSAFS